MSRLFRHEVIERRADKLYGDVNLAIPLRWHVIGVFLLGILATTLIFVVSASYARVITVQGLIVPDKGIAVAVPTRSGIVSQLLVKEGQLVARGDALAQISSGETLSTGQTVPNRIAASLQNQNVQLLDQSAALARASVAEQSKLSAQIGGLRQELINLNEQIEVQKSLVASAQKELELAGDVARRGFISRRDLLLREEQLATRQQQLSQLQQSRANRMSQLEAAQRGIDQTALQARAQAANFEATREEIARQQVDVSVASGYVLTAPTGGVATAIAAKAGQAVGPTSAILSIIPQGSKLRAELPIPASMIGFVRKGQEVKLAIDAFPYQQFGTIKAKIAVIPSAPATSTDAKGSAIPVYMTIAEIERPYIVAFGQRQPLISGMTLSARITTRKQSLIEWLFEPLYAVQRR